MLFVVVSRDQADLEFGGIGLRFGDIKSGLGLLDCGLIRPGINLQEERRLP